MISRLAPFSFAFFVALFLGVRDSHAVNWGKAMNMYYSDYNPAMEMLFTLGGIIIIGVATFYYQRYKKQQLEKRKASRNKRKDFNDLL